MLTSVRPTRNRPKWKEAETHTDADLLGLFVDWLVASLAQGKCTSHATLSVISDLMPWPPPRARDSKNPASPPDFWAPSLQRAKPRYASTTKRLYVYSQWLTWRWISLGTLLRGSTTHPAQDGQAVSRRAQAIPARVQRKAQEVDDSFNTTGPVGTRLASFGPVCGHVAGHSARVPEHVEAPMPHIMLGWQACQRACSRSRHFCLCASPQMRCAKRWKSAASSLPVGWITLAVRMLTDAGRQHLKLQPLRAAHCSLRQPCARGRCFFFVLLLLLCPPPSSSSYSFFFVLLLLGRPPTSSSSVACFFFLLLFHPPYSSLLPPTPFHLSPSSSPSLPLFSGARPLPFVQCGAGGHLRLSPSLQQRPLQERTSRETTEKPSYQDGQILDFPAKVYTQEYTWPGSNWRPSACEADVIATRPQVLVMLAAM